jgi:hypothetical protein
MRDSASGEIAGNDEIYADTNYPTSAFGWIFALVAREISVRRRANSMISPRTQRLSTLANSQRWPILCRLN